MKIFRYANEAKAILSTVLVNDTARTLVGRLRFRINQKSLKTLTASEDSITNTVPYNLQALKNLSTDFQMKRMKRLIYATLALETTAPWSKFLMIGPRTENEILLLKALGYNDVTGLDLISYSPWIRLGDMHAMPFPENSFDVIICGWTLAYSKKPASVAAEMVRVARPGAAIAVGMEHIPTKAMEAMREQSGNEKPETELIPSEVVSRRINTVKDIVGLFPQACVETVVFNHDAPLRQFSPQKLNELTGLQSSQAAAVILLKRQDAI